MIIQDCGPIEAGETPLGYDARTKTILINERCRFWDTPKNHMKRLYDRGHLCTSRPDHLELHESGNCADPITIPEKCPTAARGEIASPSERSPARSARVLWMEESHAEARITRRNADSDRAGPDRIRADDDSLRVSAPPREIPDQCIP